MFVFDSVNTSHNFSDPGTFTIQFSPKFSAYNCSVTVVGGGGGCGGDAFCGHDNGSGYVSASPKGGSGGNGERLQFNVSVLPGHYVFIVGRAGLDGTSSRSTVAALATYGQKGEHSQAFLVRSRGGGGGSPAGCVLAIYDTGRYAPRGVAGWQGFDWCDSLLGCYNGCDKDSDSPAQDGWIYVSVDGTTPNIQEA